MLQDNTFIGASSGIVELGMRFRGFTNGSWNMGAGAVGSVRALDGDFLAYVVPAAITSQSFASRPWWLASGKNRFVKIGVGFTFLS